MRAKYYVTKKNHTPRESQMVSPLKLFPSVSHIFIEHTDNNSQQLSVISLSPITISGSGGRQAPVQEEEDASRDEEGQDGVQEEDEGEEDGDDDEGGGDKEDTEPGSISRVEEPGCFITTNRDGSDGEVSIAGEAQFTDGAPLTSHFNQGSGNEAMGSEARVEKSEGKSQIHWSETGRGKETEPKPMSPIEQTYNACDGPNDRNQTTDGISVTSQPNHRGESKGYDSEAGVGESADGNQPKTSEASEQERADRGSLSPVEQANAADDSSEDGAKATDGASVISKPNQSCENSMLHSEAPVVDTEADGQPNKSETLCRQEGAKHGPILPVEQSNATSKKSDFDVQTIDRPPLTSLPNTSNVDELSHSEAKVGERGGGSRPDGLKAIYDRRAEVGSMSLVGPPNATSDRSDNDAQTIDGSSVTSHSNQSRDNEVSSSKARVGEHGGGNRPIGSATSEAAGGDGGPTKPVEQEIAADGGSDDDDHTTDGASMTSQPHQGGEEKGLGPEEEVAQSKGGEAEPEPMSPVEQANAADDSSDGEDQATNHVCVTSQTDRSGEKEVSDSEVDVGESEDAGQPNGSEAIYHRGEAEAGPMSPAERPLTTSIRPDNNAQTINGQSVRSQPSQSGEGEPSHSKARVHETGSGSQPNGSEASEAAGMDGGMISPTKQENTTGDGSDDEAQTADGASLIPQPILSGKDEALGSGVEVAESEGTSQRKEPVASERGRADQGSISPVEQANAPDGGSHDDAQATNGSSVTTEPAQGDGDEAIGSEMEVLGSDGGSHRRESVASKRERADTGPIIQVNEAKTANGGCDDEVQTTDGAPTTSESNQGGEDVDLGSEAGVGESIGCSQPTALERCCERAECDGSSEEVLTTAGASTISRGDRNGGCEAFGPEVVGGKGGGHLTNEWVTSERPGNDRGHLWPIKQENVAGDRFDDDAQATNGVSVYSPSNQNNENRPFAIEAGAGESKGGISAHLYGSADAMCAGGKAHRAPISPGEQANAADDRFDDEAQATDWATETSQFENRDSHEETRSHSGADPGSISPVKQANVTEDVSDDQLRIIDGASETSQHNQSEGEAPGPEAGVAQCEGSSQPYKRGSTWERAAAQPITISSTNQIPAGDRCDDEVQTVHGVPVTLQSDQRPGSAAGVGQSWGGSQPRGSGAAEQEEADLGAVSRVDLYNITGDGCFDARTSRTSRFTQSGENEDSGSEEGVAEHGGCSKPTGLEASGPGGTRDEDNDAPARDTAIVASGQTINLVPNEVGRVTETHESEERELEGIHDDANGTIAADNGLVSSCHAFDVNGGGVESEIKQLDEDRYTENCFAHGEDDQARYHQNMVQRDENDPPDSKTAGGFSEDEREQRKSEKNDQTVTVVTPVVPDNAATSGLTAGHDLAACNGSEVVAATVTTSTKGVSVEGFSSTGAEEGIQKIVFLAIHCEVGHHSGAKLEDQRPGSEQTLEGRQHEAVGCGLRGVEVVGMNAPSAEGLVEPAALIAVASPTVFCNRGESYGELGDSGSTYQLAPEQQPTGILASNSTYSAKWTVEQPEKLEMPQTKVDATFEDRPSPRKTKTLADENRPSTRDSACQTTWNSDAGTQTSRCSSPTNKWPNNKSESCRETTPSSPRFVSIGRGQQQQDEIPTTSAGIGGGIVSTLDIGGSELPSWARRASRRVSSAFSGDNEGRSSSLCDRQGQG